MTELLPGNDVVIGNNPVVDGAPDYGVLPPLRSDSSRRKKKSGGFGIFKAALNILRKKPDEKEAAKQRSVESDGNWKKIVGSMRPLHVQETPQSPMHHMSPVAEEYPASPAASSSCGTMSQYASALNLRDLDNSDDEEDPDEVFDAITGDEMIDAKAEEFIAQFYRQIQIQNTSRYHNQDRGI